MGVPVVNTPVSGVPEVIEHEHTGMLVEATNPQEFARTLKRIVTDLELREHIIPAARERVSQVFDNKQLIGELISLYRDLTKL